MAYYFGVHSPEEPRKAKRVEANPKLMGGRGRFV
jgi:hypothetical protein